MTSDKFALATVEVQCRSSQQAFIESVQDIRKDLGILGIAE